MFKKKERRPKELVLAIGSVQAVTLCNNSGYTVSQRARKRVFFSDILGRI